MAEQLQYFGGDLEQISGVPQALRERYRTAFQMDPAALIEAGARPASWRRAVAR